MKEVMCRVSMPGPLVFDAFSGKTFTETACLMLEKQRGFVGCDKAVDFLQKYFPRLVEVYAFQLLHKRSNLTGENQQK